MLETHVTRTFRDRATILRLPALFGPGLKKNALFDLMTDHEVEKIPANAVYQWYPLSELRGSIAQALLEDHPVANLVSDPIEMGVIQRRFFPAARLGPPSVLAPSYSVVSRYGRSSERYILGEIEAFLRG
jgi:hypothetical protein